MFVSFSLGRVMEVQEEGDFFLKTHKERGVVVLVFDPEGEHSGYEKKFSSAFKAAALEADEGVPEFLWVDLGKVPTIRRHFSVKKPSEVFLFIRNQLERIESFDPEASEAELTSFFAFLFRNRIEKINKLIHFPQELEGKLRDEDLAFVLVGGNESTRQAFQELAESNIKLTFLHSESEEISAEILQESGISDSFNASNSFICCVRRPDSVPELDEKVVCKRFEGRNSAQKFVDFEQFPRLRPRALHDDILKHLYWRRQAILFLSAGENERSVSEFTQAIAMLPKDMIYAITKQSDPEPTFLQIFMMAKQVQASDLVYIVFAVPGGDLRIEYMSKPLSKENIVTFALTFKQNNKWLFEVEPERTQETRERPGPDAPADEENPVEEDL